MPMQRKPTATAVASRCVGVAQPKRPPRSGPSLTWPSNAVSLEAHDAIAEGLSAGVGARRPARNAVRLARVGLLRPRRVAETLGVLVIDRLHLGLPAW